MIKIEVLFNYLRISFMRIIYFKLCKFIPLSASSNFSPFPTFFLPRLMCFYLKPTEFTNCGQVQTTSWSEEPLRSHYRSLAKGIVSQVFPLFILDSLLTRPSTCCHSYFESMFATVKLCSENNLFLWIFTTTGSYNIFATLFHNNP